MKKLKEYINNKPRLRKCLKIGELVLSLWGVILTIILSIGLAMASSKASANQISNINKGKSPQEAISFTNYDIYSSNEIISQNNLINYIDWVYRADGIDLYGITSNYERALTLGGNGYFVQSQNLTSSNIGTNSVRYMTLQRVVLKAFPKVVYDTNRNSQKFQLDFVSTTNSNQHLELVYFKVYNGTLGTIATWLTTGLYYYNVNSELSAYRSDLSLVIENPLDTDIAWSRQFFNFYGLGTDITADNYTNGYNAGYSRGESQGYQNGYNVGYDEGRASAQGIVNNPFDLLGNAFMAVASILDIRVLPGLSLGVLIFTPLVVTIIVVVVKMIKG